MIILILAMLGGAQAIDLAAPPVTTPSHGLILDQSSKSILRADAEVPLKSEEAVARLTNMFVTGFLDKDRLTLARPTADAPIEPTSSISLAALAAAPAVSPKLGTLGAAIKH